MKDHRPTPNVNVRYLALRDRRRTLYLPPVVRGQRSEEAVLLPPPIVHGTYNGGLRRDQLLGDFATVQVTVGPWDFPAMTDVIHLHWGDQWTQTFPVKDTNGAQLLAIPGADIAGDPIGNGDHHSGEGVQAVWYEVETLSGDLTGSSTRDVLVKTARPGGEDPRPDTPINDNLVAPTATPDPVEQDTAAVTFSVVPWTNITTDDRLTLVLAGYRFDFPGVTDTTVSQTLTLTAEQIAATGGGPSTPVTYEIVDAVGNRSGYAPYLLLDIWLEAGDRLEMIELFDDARLPVEGAIDPNMTEGFARVPRYLGWQAGESVTVVLEGVASDEQTHTTKLGPLIWNAADYYLDFVLPGDALLVLAGGIVRVHYETSSGGISYRRLYVVDALPETKLPPVTVIGEQDGELPLDAIAGDYVSVVIPDSEALVDFARVTLTMEGTGDSGPVREEEIHNVSEGQGHQTYTFAWLKTRVARLLDHAATFSYTIRTLDGARGGNRPRLYRPMAIRDSEPHELLIRQSSAPAQLAPPIVHDLIDGAVSPTLPALRLTVPGGTASVPGAKVVTTAAGLTTATRTDVIFDAGETLTVDFPGWPAVNDGAAAKAWYTVDGKPSREASFLVGEPAQIVVGTPAIPLALGNIIYMDEVPTDGLPVQVPVYEGMAAGQRLRIRCVGGQTQEAGPVEVTGVAMQTIKVPKTYWETEAGLGTPAVTVTYIVEAGGTDWPSNSLVIAPKRGTASTTAPAPTVTHVIGGQLPVDAIHVENIVPAATDLALGDILVVFWSGASGAGSPSFGSYTIREEHIGKEFITGEATAAAIEANAGGIVKVDYQVTHPGRPDRHSAEYSFSVAAYAIVLLRPEPDFLEQGGRINIDRITDARGLRVVVKKYQGMATRQRITLRCVSPAGNYNTVERLVDHVEDVEFFIEKTYFDGIVAALDPAIAAFDYTVTASDGISERSPRNDVTFYSSGVAQ